MEGDELTPEEFERFRALIYRTAGIRIPETKRVMVSNRVRRRLRGTSIPKFSDYYAHLTSPAGAAEMPSFLDEITTNETYFYRDLHHFDWLSEEFFPEAAEAARARSRPKRLRIWSAASSTGEELYSVALRLAAARHLFAGWGLTLLGTDLSASALASARAGVYDDRAVRGVPEAERMRHFHHDAVARRWTISDELKSMTTWRSHNLLKPLAEPGFDCIFIKNVLIYFDAASKAVVTKHLISALAPGGYLVVGPTEGIFAMLDPLIKRKPWLYQRPA